MLLPLAVEQIHRAIHPAGNRKQSPAPVVNPMPVQNSRDQEVIDLNKIVIPKGARYQLFRALRALNNGEPMVAQHNIPTLSNHFNSAYKRNEFFRSLNSIDSWKNPKEVEPVLVPGTSYPCVIGKILIRAEWCAPSERAHWIPNLRFFYITDLGKESLQKAYDWWASQGTLDRLRLMLLE